MLPTEEKKDSNKQKNSSHVTFGEVSNKKEKSNH
jgi:hypothetical protein